MRLLYCWLYNCISCNVGCSCNGGCCRFGNRTTRRTCI